MMTDEIKFFEQVNRNFDRTATYLYHPPGLLEQVKTCNGVYHLNAGGVTVSYFD